MVLAVKLCFCVLLNVKAVTACNEMPAKLLPCKAAFCGRADEQQDHSPAHTPCPRLEGCWQSRAAPAPQNPLSSILQELGPHAPDASCTPTGAAVRTRIHSRSTLLLQIATLMQIRQKYTHVRAGFRYQNSLFRMGVQSQRNFTATLQSSWFNGSSSSESRS